MRFGAKQDSVLLKFGIAAMVFGKQEAV
jgi:hypothetical protein